MRKSKDINELLEGGGERLTDLKNRSRARAAVLARVLEVLPPPLAAAVVSAGIDTRRLTVGVASAAWAARLRYLSEMLRTRVGESLQVDIQTVRIKVVQPPPDWRRAGG
ncbi:MAG TPA: DciA family protein [Steroidobacteraceae bacterium]|nr:DciA family protein [Steroidobacteraceae bacterium]